jgi:hypothetical protein
VWPLLSMQPAEVVQLELARAHYDALSGAGADPDALALHRREVLKMLIGQLAIALDYVPEALA